MTILRLVEYNLCSHLNRSSMPSFKERFRPSRKSKKNKDTSTIEESTVNNITSSTHLTSIPPTAPIAAATINSAVASTTTGATIDDHTGSAALSTHYSVDQRE